MVLDWTVTDKKSTTVQIMLHNILLQETSAIFDIVIFTEKEKVILIWLFGKESIKWLSRCFINYYKRHKIKCEEFPAIKGIPLSSHIWSKYQGLRESIWMLIIAVYVSESQGLLTCEMELVTVPAV